MGMDEPNVLGEATEQYTDLKGTVALDDPHDDDLLYEVASLDRDQWAIIGFSISGGRIGQGELSSAASVYAVDRSLASGLEEWVQLARERNGLIPVTQFGLRVDQAGLVLLRDVFKRWTIHAISSGFADQGLDLEIVDIVDTADEAG